MGRLGLWLPSLHYPPSLRWGKLVTTLYLDTETFCEVPIKNGTHVYAEAAEVMIATYATDDGLVNAIDLTHDDTQYEAEYTELLELLADPTITIVMHNSAFDRTVIRHALGIDIPVERVHDTMVQALAHGLPGALGTLCEILGVPSDQAKDKRGRELIRLFCSPRPKNQKLRRATRETHPAEWKEFISYAKSDIEAMRAVHRRLPKWNYRDSELALWHLDQRINDRGVAVDTTLARCAVEAIGKAQSNLADRTSESTFGYVASATQRDAMLRHILAAYGVNLPDLQMSTIERRINDDSLPVELRELLAVRLQATTSSTSKYAKLLGAVSPDGRLRGTLQFCGAARTGRWAGRTFQPQNLPRPVLKQDKIELGIESLKAGCADLFFDNIMELTSSAIRGCIIAPPGKKLVVSDLSNIEGRVAAWLAGEEWKLDAFRAYDAGTGPDLYKLAYAKAFRITPEQVDGGAKSGPQRQVGKIMELFMQYEGGVGAFLTGAAAYGIDLEEMAATAWPSVPEDIRAEAAKAWDWAVEKKRTYDLSREAYMACDALKRMWRRAHPEINSYWPQIKDTVIAAIMQPGKLFECRMLKIQRDGAWLRIRLPSGRYLCYASPKVDDGKISYMGINQYTRQWAALFTYGGKLFENICQAVARDVMAANMDRIEKSGFEIVLSVHDELITEAEDSHFYGPEILSTLLAFNPAWSAGMPLAAGGFEAYRYKKD